MISALKIIPKQKLQLLYFDSILTDIISSPLLMSNKASQVLPSLEFMTSDCLTVEFFISFDKSKICLEILKNKIKLIYLMIS
jgi:hypothetical protein